MLKSNVDFYSSVADQDRRKGLGYLAALLLSQLVVFLGFWAQITYPGSVLQLTVAVTLTFEIVSIYFAFRLYQLRYST